MEDLRDKIARLEAENNAMAEKLHRHEQAAARRRKGRRKLARAFLRVMAGSPLQQSVSQLVEEAFSKRVDKETIKQVVYATLHRLTRVGMISLLLAITPMILALIQTYYLKQQTDKLDYQNKRIEQQTFLQEAERRSSLVFLFDNVLDRVDEELKGKDRREDRSLSPQLIGRIVALSLALRPYRYLDGDTLTAHMTSPERGQLLISLINSRLSKTTCEQIMQGADFSYSTLQNADLSGAYLVNINLSNALLDNVKLVGADLSYGNLSGATLNRVSAYLKSYQEKGARFNFANFTDCNITNSDLSGSVFKHSNFTRANLRQTYLHDAIFTHTEFEQTLFDTIDFRRTQFAQCQFMPTKTSRAMELEGALLDTASMREFAQSGYWPGLSLDRRNPVFLIQRDTPFVDARGKAFIITDSVTLFPWKKSD